MYSRYYRSILVPLQICLKNIMYTLEEKITGLKFIFIILEWRASISQIFVDKDIRVLEACLLDYVLMQEVWEFA
jgi:hypothetical protein